MTETELIRSKARLKGNETKAEASAAIAEAQILAGRLAEDKSRASTLRAERRNRCAKAEEQLGARQLRRRDLLRPEGAGHGDARRTQETPALNRRRPRRTAVIRSGRARRVPPASRRLLTVA